MEFRKIAGFISLACFSSIVSAESALRISCDSDAASAKVFINGYLKGDCPADYFVQSGNIDLRVVKSVDAQYERTFVTRFNLPDNSAKKIDVVLGPPTMTTEAKVSRYKAALVAARGGDLDAMLEVAEYYQTGNGVTLDRGKAEWWRDKHESTKQENEFTFAFNYANSGDVASMKRLASYYETGYGTSQSETEQKKWEKAYAEALLKDARSGKVEAMKEVVTAYSTGYGFEKSPERAKEWQSKLDNANAENAEYERKLAQITALEQKQWNNTNNYFYTFQEGIGIMEGAQGDGDGAMFTAATTFIPLGLVSMAIDIVLTPFTWSNGLYLDYELENLKKELRTGAASWGNPDSMVAQHAKHH